MLLCFFFFFQAEDGIRDSSVTGVQTCALPIWLRRRGDYRASESGAAPRFPRRAVPAEPGLQCHRGCVCVPDRTRSLTILCAWAKRAELRVTVPRSFGLNSTNLNGPVPIGWLRMSAGRTWQG